MSPLEGTVFTNNKLFGKKFDQKLDLASSGNILQNVKFLVRLDDKGRISLPADLRRSIGIDTGDSLSLELFLKNQRIVLKRCVQ